MEVVIFRLMPGARYRNKWRHPAGERSNTFFLVLKLYQGAGFLRNGSCLAPPRRCTASGDRVRLNGTGAFRCSLPLAWRNQPPAGWVTKLRCRIRPRIPRTRLLVVTEVFIVDGGAPALLARLGYPGCFSKFKLQEDTIIKKATMCKYKHLTLIPTKHPPSKNNTPTCLLRW